MIPKMILTVIAFAGIMTIAQITTTQVRKTPFHLRVTALVMLASVKEILIVTWTRMDLTQLNSNRILVEVHFMILAPREVPAMAISIAIKT
jgi:hypothetical protein